MSVSALLPTAPTTLVILLGASAWPNSPGFQASKAFMHAAQGFRDYLLDPRGFGLPTANLLNQFDVQISTSDQLEVLGSFLEERTQALKAANQAVRDVLVYFVGHGGFAGPSADFYLMPCRARASSLRASGMAIDGLAEVLREKARQTRRYLLLDCCFAAAAFRSFQGAPDQTAIAKTLDAFAVQAKSRGFPHKGTVLLCSSDHKSPSVLLPNESCTMFSHALLDVLKSGDLHRPPLLSLRDIKELVEDCLAALPEQNAPRPGLYSPDQSEGDVADIPFFPNPRSEKEQRRLAEEAKRSWEEEQNRRIEEERVYRVKEEKLVRRAKEERHRQADVEGQVRGIEEERARRLNPQAIEALTVALENEKQEVWEKAAEALAQIGAPAVEPLIAALKKKNYEVRRRAIEALKQIGAPAVEPLIAALKDEDQEGQWYAIEALKQIGDARAVEPLIALLKISSTWQKEQVAGALYQFRDVRAIEPLIAALKDQDERWNTILTLAHIGSPAVEPLIAALKDENYNVRDRAAKVLGYIGSRAVEPLIATSKNENQEVRMWAFEALKRIREPALESLIAALKDEDPEMRKWATEGPKRFWVSAVEPLIAALKDEDPEVRKWTIEALKKIKSQYKIENLWAIGFIEAALKDENPEVRKWAFEALKRVGTPEAIAALENPEKYLWLD